MKSFITKSDSSQPVGETAVYLFDDWFDPIEAGVRDRVRGFVQAMIEGGLDETLMRPRYGRRLASSSGKDDGLIVWFARDFQGWYPVRSVLIASVVGLLINVVLNIWATVTGLLNANAWGSTVVLLLLLVGAVYQLIVRELEARSGRRRNYGAN
jgi:hypothetical protein